MRKLLLGFLSVIVVMLLFNNAAHAVEINVNGQLVVFTEETGFPFIDENGRTLVPLRVTMQTAGAGVQWSEVNQMAGVYKNKINIHIPIGYNHINVDGKMVPNDAAAVIVEGRTYLPIRAVLEALNFNVQWDEASQTVIASDYVTVTEWAPYYTGDSALLRQNIADGHVIYRDGQFWASPEYLTMIANQDAEKHPYDISFLDNAPIFPDGEPPTEE